MANINAFESIFEGIIVNLDVWHLKKKIKEHFNVYKYKNMAKELKDIIYVKIMNIHSITDKQIFNRDWKFLEENF